ncbi:MAG: hypothetical protein IJR91_03680 [Ruminococcus sp.]|nr:hypothetical protein [Ruminococcus sp.]
MNYKIVDLTEPDNGCEGYLPGEEPMVTLALEDGRRISVPDMLAYKMGWDVGSFISSEDIQKFAKDV